ncbi:unnamed protein product [Peniophora sp. CBMAI 1063]|nr:unnamed protein product [Peniophora sp. CBMAI 1063]
MTLELDHIHTENRGPGRPSKFGPPQCVHFDGRQIFYNALRRQPRPVTQAVKHKFLDNELYLFFSVFGWDDPEQTTSYSKEPTESVVAECKAEVLKIEKQAKKGVSMSDRDTERDQLVKRVRTNMSQRFLSKYNSRYKTATDKRGSAADIQKLIQMYMEKPTLRHQCKVWASSHPGFEAQVDARLLDLRLEKGDPNYPRIGLWNTMASQGYAATDDKVKEETVRKAKEILEKDMKDWEKGLAPPKSVEEATQFMSASQLFLEDLMQFFAERCGGMAVMILAGAGNVLLSQGTCDVAGMPKVLYGDIAGERKLLEGLAGRIHTQACLVSESKWGVRLSDGAPAAARSSQEMNQVPDMSLRNPLDDPAPLLDPAGGDTRVTDRSHTEECDPPARPVGVPPSTSLPEATACTASNREKHANASTPRNEEGNEPAREDDLSAAIDPMPDSRVAEIRCTNEREDTYMAETEQYHGYSPITGPCESSLTTAAHGNVDEPSNGMPQPRPRPRPKPVARGKVVRVEAANAANQPTATLAEIGRELAALEHTDCVGNPTKAMAPRALEPQEQYGSTRSGRAEAKTAHTTQGEHAGTLFRPVPQETTDGVFAYQISDIDTATLDLKVYKNDCDCDGKAIEGRVHKKWFIQTGMTNFFLGVPKKLKGKVDIGLACAVVRSYMKLELSGEVSLMDRDERTKTHSFAKSESDLDLSRYKVGHQQQPEYTASLQNRGPSNQTRMTWHKKVPSGVGRKPAQLDQNIGSLLGKQWAYQQADARRRDDGTLYLKAHPGMDWCKRLTPGLYGVRLLVLTLLCWGAEIDSEAKGERMDWINLAKDFVDVLNVLTSQARPYQLTEAELERAQGDTEKRKMWVIFLDD